MRGLKLTERFKSTQVHALSSSSSETNGGNSSKASVAAATKPHNYLKRNKTMLPSWSKTKSRTTNNNSTSSLANLALLRLPSTDTIEPSIEPHLKPINLVETLSELYHRMECCTQSNKALMCAEQYSLLRGLGDQKILRRCLRTACQNAEDVFSKVVLSAWLRFERRDDELVGVCSMDCAGYVVECPKKNLEHGFSPCSVNDHCQCQKEPNQETCTDSVCLPDEESDVLFCVGSEEISCVRCRIAALSDPFNAMLYGGFAESKTNKIDFSGNGICPKGMRAVEFYSRTKRLDLFCPMTVLELLSFANRFCCVEMRSACDAHLASIVVNVEDALVLIEYGLEERATLLVGACLQVLLRELPNSLYNPKVAKIFCSFEAKERLANVGCASFLLYYFLSQVAMEESMERALYNMGKEKSFDLDVATELDPSLSFPYKYRALAKVEEKKIKEGIIELDRFIGFKLSPDCLELRAWLYVALEDYDSAMRDIRALLTIEPNYITSHGKIKGEYLLQLLNRGVQQKCQADCWMQLYQQWSCVDDIGSLAIIHQMLENEPGKSVLEFRQSLLLLRLNCQKAAMRSLRLARNHSSSMQERLVYEGWILYDTGYRKEALARADISIAKHRSFEAFFLKAYVLADTTLDPESSSYVIQLLKEALKCPSDGLRKGQALNNLGSIYVDCGKLELAKECYKNALAIRHTRAHQGVARIYHQKNQRKAAYDEMTKLIEKAESNASAYEKRSEYCDREMAKADLDVVTQLDPLRTYPYRYRAAVMMDEQKETEAVEELTKAIKFKPDLQMLHLRAAFYESMGDLSSALQDCQAALCLDPNHAGTLDVYRRIQRLNF
ncbi:hypothetical protein JHK87_049158 [Glycine soja]|nr:hypothetical protein JHK87_049158 [Glycine soja]